MMYMSSGSDCALVESAAQAWKPPSPLVPPVPELSPLVPEPLPEVPVVKPPPVVAVEFPDAEPLPLVFPLPLAPLDEVAEVLVTGASTLPPPPHATLAASASAPMSDSFQVRFVAGRTIVVSGAGSLGRSESERARVYATAGDALVRGCNPTFAPIRRKI